MHACQIFHFSRENSYVRTDVRWSTANNNNTSRAADVSLGLPTKRRVRCKPFT